MVAALLARKDLAWQRSSCAADEAALPKCRTDLRLPGATNGGSMPAVAIHRRHNNEPWRGSDDDTNRIGDRGGRSRSFSRARAGRRAERFPNPADPAAGGISAGRLDRRAGAHARAGEPQGVRPGRHRDQQAWRIGRLGGARRGRIAGRWLQHRDFAELDLHAGLSLSEHPAGPPGEHVGADRRRPPAHRHGDQERQPDPHLAGPDRGRAQGARQSVGRHSWHRHDGRIDLARRSSSRPRSM